VGSDHDVGPVLINETLARQIFAGENPLGQRVDPGWNEEGLHVVGVVGDIMGGDPTRPPPPAFYFPIAVSVDNAMGLIVRTSMSDPLDVLPTVRQSVTRLDSEVPVFQVRSLEEVARSRLGTRRFAMSLFGVFAVLALVLGAIGVYGVMSFAVTQRVRELGVRLALGASRGSVLRMVLRQGMRLTLPGVIIGVVLSLGASRALRGLLFNVSELDPSTYVGVAILLAVVSVVASSIPAYRATRVDPLTSIQNE
jgi:putative ABC transport system permease protein